MHRILVPGEAAGERLDRFLPAALAGAGGPELSRAALQNWIRDGAVRVNGRTTQPRQSLAGGDWIEVTPPSTGSRAMEGEDIPLVVLFEDEDLIVVDKPPGLVVHPGAGNEGGTLVNALLHHCGGKLSRLADEDRPGIVHRLDKETSGCVVAAKTDQAYESLVAQFSGRETRKEYLAVTEGVPAEVEGHIVTRIGRHPVSRQRMAVLAPPAGKEAITDYRVLRSDPAGAWASLSCIIRTGRTHQIRVHLKEVLHCPILGDTIYAQVRRQRVPVDRLLLHARRLGFRHPLTGATLSFEASVPEAFAPYV